MAAVLQLYITYIIEILGEGEGGSVRWTGMRLREDDQADPPVSPADVSMKGYVATVMPTYIASFGSASTL